MDTGDAYNGIGVSKYTHIDTAITKYTTEPKVVWNLMWDYVNFYDVQGTIQIHENVVYSIIVLRWFSKAMVRFPITNTPLASEVKYTPLSHSGYSKYFSTGTLHI
jgi:hypothetical protein